MELFLSCTWCGRETSVAWSESELKVALCNSCLTADQDAQEEETMEKHKDTTVV